MPRMTFTCCYEENCRAEARFNFKLALGVFWFVRLSLDLDE